MMLMLQMMLELCGLVCCFVCVVSDLFVCFVSDCLILSSFAGTQQLCSTHQVLLRGVSVSPLLCSFFTQRVSSSTKFLLA